MAEADDRLIPGTGTRVVELADALAAARFLAEQPEIRFFAAVGLEGYGSTKPGDKVLICTDTLYDPRVAEVLAVALREKRAKVDQIVIETEPDREFTEVDEIAAMMRRGPWTQAPRRYEGIHWVEQLAARERYDLLILGRGGPGNLWDPSQEGAAVRPGDSPGFRYEQIPWFDLQQLVAESTLFPRDLHILINQKVHQAVVEMSKGGRIHLRDPEGTDISWTNFDGYYGDRYWCSRPIWCHILAHASPPILPQEDAVGVIAGTIAHFARPFPTVRTYIDGGKLTKIDGGGKYGEAWRALLEETRSIKYPNFPREGLFWLWEVAIGTNPKVKPEPPERIRYISSGGVEKERARSGVIHMGIGTNWRDADEVWASPRGILHGHLHVHLSFPTLDVHTREGGVIRVIDNGHLTALDDPEVRALAAKYGDQDEVLKEAWTPKIPGINVPGNYQEDYGRDPAAWIYSGKRDS